MVEAEVGVKVPRRSPPPGGGRYELGAGASSCSSVLSRPARRPRPRRRSTLGSRPAGRRPRSIAWNSMPAASRPRAANPQAVEPPRGQSLAGVAQMLPRRQKDLRASVQRLVERADRARAQPRPRRRSYPTPRPPLRSNGPGSLARVSSEGSGGTRSAPARRGRGNGRLRRQTHSPPLFLEDCRGTVPKPLDRVADRPASSGPRPAGRAPAS